MLHAEPFETHLLSSELCVLFIYFVKGNCIGLEYHIILSKIHIIVIIKTKIIDQNKSCSNNNIHNIFFLNTSSKIEDISEPKLANPNQHGSHNIQYPRINISKGVFKKAKQQRIIL